VIDGNLTEINVTSPTGIRAIARLGGPDIAAKIWDVIEQKREVVPSCDRRSASGLLSLIAVGARMAGSSPAMTMLRQLRKLVTTHSP
jgi:hypothetical protein